MITLRKGPSFVNGMSQIMTPSAADESMKVMTQSSHRILTKGASQGQLVPQFQIIKSSLAKN